MNNEELLKRVSRNLETLNDKPSQRILEGQTALDAAKYGGFVEYIVPLSQIGQTAGTFGAGQPTWEQNIDGYFFAIAEEGTTLGATFIVSLWADGNPIKIMTAGDVYVGRFSKVRVLRPAAGGKYDNNINRPAYLHGTEKTVRFIIGTQPESRLQNIRSGDRNMPVMQSWTQYPTATDKTINYPTTSDIGLDINGARGMRFVVSWPAGDFDEDASGLASLTLAWRPPDENEWVWGYSSYPGETNVPAMTTDGLNKFVYGLDNYIPPGGSYAPMTVPLSGRTVYGATARATTYDIPVFAGLGEVFPILLFESSKSFSLRIKGYAWK